MHYNGIAVRRRLGTTPNRVYCRRRCVVIYIYLCVCVCVYIIWPRYGVPLQTTLPYGVRKTELNFTSVSSARFIHTYLYNIYITGATVAPAYIYRYYYYFYYIYIDFFLFSFNFFSSLNDVQHSTRMRTTIDLFADHSPVWLARSCAYICMHFSTNGHV